MINYTITRTQETTKITLPEGTIKYHNKLNNTSYYTNKAEQRIRTHQRSWKTIATVYLDNITLNTETITTDTVFTFHLKNTTNNTSIDIPVNNKLADFQTNITSVLNPKHFYIVDLDNTSRFQTHFLDFINTVLIELNTNSTVLNELIEDTPVEEPTTPENPLIIKNGILPYFDQTVTGELVTVNNRRIIPVIIDTYIYDVNDDVAAQFYLFFKDVETNKTVPIVELLRDGDVREGDEDVTGTTSNPSVTMDNVTKSISMANRLGSVRYTLSQLEDITSVEDIHEITFNYTTDDTITSTCTIEFTQTITTPE